MRLVLLLVIVRFVSDSSSQLIEMIDADLRPRLKTFATLLQFGFGEKGEVGDHCFTLLHLRLCETKNVHHPEVHATHLAPGGKGNERARPAPGSFPSGCSNGPRDAATDPRRRRR